MKLKFTDKGVIDYAECLDQMLSLIRTKPEGHEIWYLEHPSVFTIGISEKKIKEDPNSMPPIYKTDRGGKITYHGIGQIVFYFMLNLKKTPFKPSELTKKILVSTSDAILGLGLKNNISKSDPGLYVNGEKLASIGMRIKSNYSYHGISLNHDVNLKEFNSINPCGLDVKACNLSKYINIKQSKLAQKLKEAYTEMLKIK
tara:strand:+ start:5018 stop:5617 length:600 start_codon:yes stop_codon:yes gene_type:complete